MNRHTIVYLIIVLLLIFGGVRAQSDLVFINGQILTLDANSRVVEAMLVADGRIAKLGSNHTVIAYVRSNTTVIDLKGRAVLPGFIDAHSHFPASGIRAVSVDLSPPPIGDTYTLEKLLSQLSTAAEVGRSNNWLLGYNYDNIAFHDRAHPTRAQLDSVVPDQPVYLWHNSGHMGVGNSKALALLGIDESSVPPQGGNYGIDQNGRLNGLLQENAAPPLADIIQQYSLRQQLLILTSARDEYLAAGYTTVQNGYAGKNMMRVLRLSQLVGLLPQRVIIWPADKKQRIEHKPVAAAATQFNYRVGAVKILVDGSPQGLTAFLSKPYFNIRDQPADYRGISLIGQTALNELVSDYHLRGYQLALHGNGDAAIESIIDAVTIAQTLSSRPDARHILVHAQTLRQDQIEKLFELSLSPSFFTAHSYFWGDWHRQFSLGLERARNISPARSTQEAGVRFSLHTDSPVTPIGAAQMLWSATQRKTQSGFQLGAEQSIDMETALRAITIDAAWQNHIEESVGSLEVGKYADLVVLSQNPIEISDVRDIDILSTYINGVKRYQIGATSTSD